MKGKKLFVGLATLSTLVLASCGDAEVEENANTEEVASEESTAENGENTPETVEIEDAAGNVVEVPFNPERVAVFDNGVLDNIHTLGKAESVILTVEGEKPEHISVFNEVEGAGSFFEVDLEAVFAADPDLIIVAGRSSDALEDLSEIAPTIDLSRDFTDYFGSVETNLNRLAQIYGEEEQAETILQDLKAQMDDVASRAEDSGIEALVAMYNEGSLSAYGPASRYGVIHEQFGFAPVDEGIEASNHGMEISFEYVLEQDPDVIFVLDRTAAIGGDNSGESLEENPLIQETQAYQNDQIIYLTPGPWYLAEGGAGTFEIMLEEVSTVLD
jgi:iron complex transport system substrate-binding protein